MEKTKKKKRGGARPNSGRKPKVKKLTNYEKAIKLFDDSIEKALMVLIDGLDDEDKAYRLKCAELLVKKGLPDKKIIASDSDNPPVFKFIIE